MYRLGAVLLLTWSFVATAQAQQTTLTLACKGTTTAPMMSDDKPQPVSMGIIVNFSARTVQGFVSPGLEFPVKITAANDVTIEFSGYQQLPSSLHSILGSIDRVTGDVEATSLITDPKTSKSISQTTYTLQCRPTQRMF
jgi:hypothetical protein